MANVILQPDYQTINGIRFPAFFPPTCVKQALSYKPKPEDVFIVTYPKCGTTWMQNVTLYIFRKGKELENHKEIFNMSPFIDCFGDEGINNMPRPGAFKTHFAYNHVPYSPHSKYIYVLRNPKDCCVSLYHHTKTNIAFQYWDGKFVDFFELFLAGEVEYNDYFDHLMSWYPHRNDSQVFFTTYEEMKTDIRDVVLKLAKFLGRKYIDAIEKDNNSLNNILHFSSFDYMKKRFTDLFNFNDVSDEELNSPEFGEGLRHIINHSRSINPPEKKELDFIRKGTVGDWKSQFSKEQSERLNEKFLLKTKGTDIYEMYKPYI